MVLAGIVLFSLGSALCGSAKNMDWFLSGRGKYPLSNYQFVAQTVTGIQGAGGGTIFSLAQIIISDLVPLRERGVFQGATGL